MILAQANTQNIYLHQARNSKGIPEYILIYGLQTEKISSRVEAFRKFAFALDHAELCETGYRPIYG